MDKHRKEIVKLLTKVEDPKLMEDLLKDLLTSEEFRNISKRWQLVKMLHKETPQREINKKLKVAIATITRGALKRVPAILF